MRVAGTGNANGRLVRSAGRALERLTGAEVHDREGRIVLAFFANLFLLLVAYYILKVIREPLILLGGGAVSRSYARGAQAVVLVALIPAYSRLANKIEPARLVGWITAFFIACLLAFFALGRTGVSIGFAFFVWLGIFSTLSIAQFWSLANDLLTDQEGKRLFPLMAAGGTLGGIIGAQIAARAAEWLDPYQLILVAAVVLTGSLGATLVGRRVGARYSSRWRERRGQLASDRDVRGAFALVLRDRYLILIAGSVVILNLVNTTGDFILAHIVNDKAQLVAAAATDASQARQRFISGFYGDFQTYVSVLTAVVQILVVGRIFRFLGIGRALFVLPLVALFGYGASALLPTLMLMASVKVVENSADYSLQNTLQQALFLPTSRDAKYKGKAAIDTLSVRLGDLASTGLVFAGVQLGLSIAGFALANVAASLVWLVLVARLARRYQRAAPPARAARPPVPAATPA